MEKRKFKFRKPSLFEGREMQPKDVFKILSQAYEVEAHEDIERIDIIVVKNRSEPSIYLGKIEIFYRWNKYKSFQFYAIERTEYNIRTLKLALYFIIHLQIPK